jgi:hypothetical protein
MLYFGLTNVLFLLRYALAYAQDLGRQVYYPVLLGLFLFSAFRYQVGCDWSGYYYQYLSAANIDWSFIASNPEPLWWAILAWIQAMGLPYPVANIASSALFFIGVHVLARRQPDSLGFLVLLFPILIINLPMSGIRQGAATGLLCIAFTSFIDRRPILFTIWVVIASGFHVSALIFLILLPITTGRYTKMRLIMTALITIPGVILLARGEIAEVASSRYIGTDLEAFGAVFRTGVLGLSAMYFFLFLRRKWIRIFPQDFRLASLGAIGMVLVFLLIPISSVIADRFGYYLIPIQAIIFSRLPFLNFRHNQSLHSALPYIGLLAMFFIWTQLSGHFQQCYIPYDSWIFGLPSGDFLR